MSRWHIHNLNWTSIGIQESCHQTAKWTLKMQISTQVKSFPGSSVTHTHTTHTHINTCTHTINWTPNNQAYEDPVPSDDRTYFLIFPDLTHDFLTDRRILCPSRQCNPLRFTLNLPTRWRGYVCTVCVSTGVILTVLWSERVWSIYSSLGSSVSERKISPNTLRLRHHCEQVQTVARLEFGLFMTLHTKMGAAANQS